MCSRDCFKKPSFKKSKKDDEDYVPKSDGNASFLRAARSGNLDKVLEYLKGNVDINTCNANGLNALHLASKEGHIKVVTELLNRGANIEATTKKGNTALHIAALAGQEDIVKLLVQNEAKVNVQATHGGFTPLYMAAQENHKDVVKYLLANGASQTLATEDGFTPLAVALQQGHDKVVAILLENDTRGKVRLPALHIASKKDDVKAASLLLDNDHNVDGTSKSGFTPLHIASHYGNINVGELLLKKGANPNYVARNNITPMHVASKWGRTNMVTLLLENQADSECTTRDGLTPLHCAARSGHDQVVDILLEKGAVVAPKSKNGLTPLHMAAQGDHVDCARLLLFHKAPIDDVTQDYLTPLHVAAHCGNVKTAKLLLDRKCEVNARALNGFTPLHVACKKNRIKVVELLLKYGGSIEATTESGLTPLHVASFMGHMNIVVYLIQHGANPDTPTVRGETSLHLAARANQTDIMRILLRNGATVDARAREDQTPLHIASRLGNVDNVVLLLQHGASPDATTKDLYTPLHIAAKEGHEEIAGVLIDNGASQNLTTKKGFTPLHIAAKYGNLKVAKLLLDRESDPNVQGKNGLTPLHVATHYNNNDVAHLLLENGASPHATAKNGYTPLHIAAKKNQMDIAGTLLEYKADPDAQSRNGFTPLHLASQEGHTDMVNLLCEKNANVNCQAKNGLTPMHLAAQEDKVPVAEVLVKYGADIDPQTKAGYTPLHTACHFGQINMIRFLLEHGANVNAKTKLGYTPLHQAAQQGHVLVINLLLKYNADPNVVSQNGQTPLSIAQKLGYISVVECLKHITEAEAEPSDEKYKVMSPETMQEGGMTDSEDEGGDDTLMADNSYTYLQQDDMKILQDDSISPTKDESDLKYLERYSVATTYSNRESTLSREYRALQEEMNYEGKGTDQGDFPAVFDRFESIQEEKLMSSVASPTLQYPSQDYPDYQVEEQIQMTESRPIEEAQRSKDIYGSYSGVSFASSFDPDNVNVDRHPVYSGFLVSFMVDARGGAMRGCRHSGVRIIIPPGKACMPTRVTCKLVKKEKLLNPPAIMEGEALASRILEMGPVNAKFLGPVIIEVPHFASLRGKEREITILRSDDGENWYPHTMEATEEAIHEALQGSFEDLESAEELYQKRITRILTTDFPQYFAIVTRVRQEHNVIGSEGGMLSSTVVPQVQAVFPEGALTKKIQVGLQAQPVSPELVSKMLGNRVAVSPIVTVEPRRRKFHKPITVTIPVPKASQKGMLNRYEGEAPTLRLLCSITGGASPAQWEDITRETPLTHINDTVSFTTSVSARFWLIDCQNYSEAAKMASELYREATAVPFMSKFVVFAKQHDPAEARLRVFCMTDDKMDKTLELQEHFSEVAISRDVEVLEGKPHYVEMGGNLLPVTKSGDQLHINFHAFRENRLPFTVRIRDTNQDPVGRVAFMKEPKVARGEAPQTPICNLNIKLPGSVKGEPSIDVDPEELKRKYDIAKGGVTEVSISRAELRLTDIAEKLGHDWKPLADQLEISPDEKLHIQEEYPNDVSEQGLIMLHLWMQKNGERATGNELEKALRKIGREDIIRQCIYSLEQITDVEEKRVAKTVLSSDFDEFKAEIGSSRDSSMRRDMSLDVSYDEQDLVKESESAAEESGSDKGSVVEKDIKGRVDLVDKTEIGSTEITKHFMEDSDLKVAPASRPDDLPDDGIVPQVDERRAPIKSPSVDEQDQASRQKQEAFLALANQLGDVEDIEGIISRDSDEEAAPIDEESIEPEKRDTPTPVEELVDKMEGFAVHGMDDRRSISSQSSEGSMIIHSEDQATKTRTEQTAPALSRESPPPVVEDMVTAEKGHEVHGMDDRRVSLGSTSSEGSMIIHDDQAAKAQFTEQPALSRESPPPVEEMITAEKGHEVHGVDDRRLSFGSEQSSEGSVVVQEEDQDGTVHEKHRPYKTKTPPSSPTMEVTEISPEYEVEEVWDGTQWILVKKTLIGETITTYTTQDEDEPDKGEDAIVPQEDAYPLSASPEPELGSPYESDTEKSGGGVRVYTDTIEGEPEVEQEVEEFEEELPDGTIVKRKVIKTRQKQTIVKRVVMEGPEDDLPSTEEQAQLMLSESGAFEDMKYTDHTETEPELATDVKEYEETLDDGTVVKRKVVTTTESQLKTERTIIEGTEPVQGYTDDMYVDEEEVRPDIQERVDRAPPMMSAYDEPEEVEPEVGMEYQEPVETGALAEVVQEPEVEFTPRDSDPFGAPQQYPTGEQAPEISIPQDSTQPEVNTNGAPTIAITEDQMLPADEEDFTKFYGLEKYTEQEMQLSPRSIASDGTAEFEDAQEQFEEVTPGRDELLSSSSSDIAQVEDVRHAGETYGATASEDVPMESASASVFTEPRPSRDVVGSAPPYTTKAPSPFDMTRVESMDDDMREVDPTEHEDLRFGIPQHMAGYSQQEPWSVYSDDFEDSEGLEMEAAGGDMESTKLVMKKQVHKKTIIRDGKEETIITEDTHIEQDNEVPEELQQQTQKFIDEFME